jgi:hypothetical protein
MKKTLLAIATSAAIAGAMLAPTTADARCRGCFIGGALLGGALLGAAIANSGPVYAAPAPGPGPIVYDGAGRCYMDQEIWSRRYQDFVLQRVRVPCP